MSYPLLERINAPGEIKNLPASDMPALCEEIRQFLIKSVSETGGHLSSNLGVVELTPHTKTLEEIFLSLTSEEAD